VQPIPPNGRASADSLSSGTNPPARQTPIAWREDRVYEPYAVRRVALDDLQVEREVGDRSKEGEPNDEADEACDGEDAVSEQPEWQDRFFCAAFDERERDCEQRAERDRHEHRSRGLGKRPPAETRNERRKRACERDGSDVVDRPTRPPGRRGKHDLDHGDGQRAERQAAETRSGVALVDVGFGETHEARSHR
jgi:hypothetical protein